MSYIDKEFYDEEFYGLEIPFDEFDRIADIASDIVYDVCRKKPDEDVVCSYQFKKAVCYQSELIFRQGGTDAILGFSEASQVVNESLGDYSVSSGTSNQQAAMNYNGVPVSPLAVMILRKLGLMSRCVYS